MVARIRIAAWILIAFAVPGLIYSVTILDWSGLLINVLLLIIGVLDLRNLRLATTNPKRGWTRIAWSQLALGLVIGISFIYVGEYLAASPYWDTAREIMDKVNIRLKGERVPDNLWADAMGRSLFVLDWGTKIGAVLIFLGQVWVCMKIRRLANVTQPPPLPGNQSDNH